ncbi:2-succinyl-5-enolpyruvyl-6-hydroxy-3-cyclohexene-1-carboxylic-acid synthase [Agrilactobacillus fermenti]|uniref:2-succinyl-5-enolpyruvyl-6-hydroxy-3- cyclohexene-1-carboxylic-acid synthase n=1 Tax=Agrilactobacillus fermenti TaxID=2586909 RepID=UPI003A5C4644
MATNGNASTEAAQTLTTYVHTLIAALLAQKITHVVLAPGSRSTPVALILAQYAQAGRLTLHVDVDERSAGFYALGLTKVNHQPTLLVCTSGTAAANFLPAICEARLTNQPLIVLTTDRPPELTNIGAPQAIDQVKLYGDQVKNFTQLPLPSTCADELAYLDFNVQRQVIYAQQIPMGPVHLNLPLRKPLMPILDQPLPKNLVKPVAIAEIKQQLMPTLSTQIKQLFSNKKVLVIAGPDMTTTITAQDQQFLKTSGWLILADVLSGLRGQNMPNVIHSYDILLQQYPQLPTELMPDIILRLGTTPVSAGIKQLLQHFEGPIVYLDSQATLADYTKSARLVLPGTFQTVSQAGPFINAPEQESFNQRWQTLQTALTATVSQTLAAQTALSEIQLPVIMAATLTAGNIFLSNSMPIRDFDNYFEPQNSQKFAIYCNRGANGIDGVTSTALGIFSQSANAANFLVTGDLAFFHDLTGLMMAQRYHLNVTIIVINNNGGGIFSFLPQHAASDYFETVFGTPQNLNIEKIAMAYNFNYQLIKNKSALQKALSQSNKGPRILEIQTDREINLKQHQALTQKIKPIWEANFADFRK